MVKMENENHGDLRDWSIALDKNEEKTINIGFKRPALKKPKAQKKSKDEEREIRKAIMYGKHTIDSGKVNLKFGQSSDRIDFMDAAQGKFVVFID